MELRVVNMRVDLRGIQVFVTEHFLQRADIDAVLQHQGCGGMTQFVSRILACVQSGFEQIFLEHHLNAVAADPISPVGEKHGAAAL